MRLAAAEEKATEAEFLRLALKEKMSQKHHDDTTKYVKYHLGVLIFFCDWMP